MTKSSRISFLLLSLLIFIQNSSAITIDEIYSHLTTVGNGKYLKYNDISYRKPSLNHLNVKQLWLLQTPNSFQGSSEYNLSFKPAYGAKLDSEFNVPTCDKDKLCLGVATCQIAGFSLDKRQLCLTPAYEILQRIEQLISQAQTSVDILTLGNWGISNGGFSLTLKNAIQELAQRSINSDKKITIRLLEGSHVPFTSRRDQALLQAENLKSFQTLYQYITYLTADLPKGNKLRISVANIRSCELAQCGNENDQDDLSLDFSWNHAKIINVDNEHLITGGENLWGDDYLGRDPVNDINIEINGEAATGATIYANALWRYVNHNQNFTVNYCYTYENGEINKTCIENIPPQPIVENKIDDSLEVIAMPISKLNNGVGIGNDADQSEIARVYAFKNAEHSIKISQQALFVAASTPHFYKKILHPHKTIDGNIIDALAEAIYQKSVNVYIITSALNDKKGYDANVPLSYIFDTILENIITNYKISKENAQRLLQQHLHLGYISDKEKSILPSHHKFWMVDDHLFYIGSHNFYPSSVQEFGVIIDSVPAASIVIKDFWDPMWQYVRN